MKSIVIPVYKNPVIQLEVLVEDTFVLADALYESCDIPGFDLPAGRLWGFGF